MSLLILHMSVEGAGIDMCPIVLGNPMLLLLIYARDLITCQTNEEALRSFTYIKVTLYQYKNILLDISFQKCEKWTNLICNYYQKKDKNGENVSFEQHSVILYSFIYIYLDTWN